MQEALNALDIEKNDRKMYHMEIRRNDRELCVPFDVYAESEEAALRQLPADFVFVRWTDCFSWPQITELEVIEP